MSSIDQVLIPGTGIRVEFVNMQGDKVAGQSRINRYEGIYLVLDTPKPLHILNDLTLNQNLAIICKYNDQPEDFVFFVKYIKNKDTDPPLMMVSKPDNFTLGRKAFRCEVNIPFGYYNGQSEYNEGLLLNLSSNGLFASIKPDESLQIGIDIPLKLQLPTGSSPILIMGKVERMETLEKESRIALSFSYLPNDIHDLIGRFLSNAQGSTIRKTQQKKTAIIKLHNEKW